MVVFGAEIDGGKRGGGDRWEQVTTSLVESVVQQLAGSRCPAARRRVGGKRTASGRRQGEEERKEERIKEKMIFTAVRKRRLQ